MASKALSFDIRDNNSYPWRRGDEAQVKNLKWHKESSIGSFEKSRKDLFNNSLSKILKDIRAQIKNLGKNSRMRHFEHLL